MEYKKLYTNYPTHMYELMITVKVNQFNHAEVEFHKNFVSISPPPSLLTELQQLKDYHDDPMNAYFNQYAFALYCASTLCGVTKDHLTRGLPLTQSIYKFHVMYQTKKILHELRAKTFLDNEFHPLKNPYSKEAYQRLLNEFGIVKGDVPVIDQPNGGLGIAIQKKDGSDSETAGPMSLQQYYELPGSPPMPTYSSTGASYYWEDIDLTKFDNRYYAFESQMDKTKSRKPAGDLFGFWQGGDWNQGGGTFATIKFIKQDPVDYDRFVADHPSQVRKDMNTERINESIRAYVWCLYTAQSEIRSSFTSDRKEEAQKRFVELVPSTFDWSLQNSVIDFQNALKNTEGEINYVIAPGLYMIPGNLILKINTVPGWNDRVKTARQLARPGFNPYNVQDHAVTTHHTEEEHVEKSPQPARQSLPGPTGAFTPHTEPMTGTRPTPYRPPRPPVEERSLPDIFEPTLQGNAHEKHSDYSSHQGSLILVSTLMIGGGIFYTKFVK